MKIGGNRSSVTQKQLFLPIFEAILEIKYQNLHWQFQITINQFADIRTDTYAFLLSELQ